MSATRKSSRREFAAPINRRAASDDLANHDDVALIAVATLRIGTGCAGF